VTIWLLTVGILFEVGGQGLPYVTEYKCKEAAAMAAFSIPGIYYCTEVQRVEEHNLFFIELAQSKERVARARARRQLEQAIRAVYRTRRR
jgi:hypothetical protein